MPQRARLPAIGADVSDLMHPAGVPGLGEDVTALFAPPAPRPRVSTPPPLSATAGMLPLLTRAGAPPPFPTPRLVTARQQPTPAPAPARARGAGPRGQPVINAPRRAGGPGPTTASTPRRGQIEVGNIDLYKQPVVKNPEGGTSTVYSFSVNVDGKEYLLPRVTPDGRLLCEDDAVNEFKTTGRHLGVFSDPDSATVYAKRLHEDYEAGKYAKKPATFLESVGRGVDVAQQLGYGALEAAGELTGLDSVAGMGRLGRQRNAADVAGQPRATLSDIKGVSDFAQWAKETIGEQIPIMAPILASSAAGAAIGSAVVPVIGTTIGGVIGAVVPSLAFGVGEVQTSIKERGEDQSAPGMAFLGGSAIAALDSILPAKIGSRLVKAFGGELAEEIAKRALLKPAADTMIRRTAKGAAAGFATEGFTEAVQEAVGDVAAALGTGTPVSPDLPRRMVEAGAAGALVGVVAAGAGAMPSARRTATPPVTVPPLGIVAREPLTATPTAPVTPTPVVAGTVTPPAVAPVVPPVVDLSPPKAERDEHKFASTQVNLPEHLAAPIIEMARCSGRLTCVEANLC